MDPEPSLEDLARMKALQQKRTLAFVNHCMMKNMQCLNNFVQVCEDKLMQFERQLDRVDAAIVLLESKLLSVPEVSAFVAEAKETSAVLEPIHEDLQADSAQTIAPSTDDTVPTHDSEDSPVKPRPEYKRFVKMVQVGVPLQAAKLKCALEGLDPNVLAEILAKKDPF